MHNYIGVDAHSKSCMFVVIDGRGREKLARRIKTSESEILKVVRSIQGKKYLTFEESHLSKWLHVLLKDEVDKLVVCDPRYITRRRGTKDDYPDTVHLAQQLRGNFLVSVFHEDNFFSSLRGEVSAYDDLVRELTRAKNRYKALFRSEARDTEGSSIYHDQARIAELTRESDQFVAKGLFEQVAMYEGLRAQYRKRFEAFGQRYPEIRALSTIPGISSVRACFIGAIICSPFRFADKYKFWAYCRLVKYTDKSDDVVYGKRNTPGNRLLNSIFMGAAQTILQKSLDLRVYYDEQRKNDVDHKAAKKNLARKIAAIALAIMRTKKPYNLSLAIEGKTKSA